MFVIRFLAVTMCVLLLSAAHAETYRVGPDRPYKDLGAVAGLLAPGDLVEVDGNATYPPVLFTHAGTTERPIVVRGRRLGGKRPVISGGKNTVDFRLSNYMVFEGFEVTGGANRGIYHHAAFITVRDTLVRDCPGQGITGADNDSGPLLLEYCEVARCGNGSSAHPVYLSTDPEKYPHAVFRMQFCYVHDGTGGNAVKSRAERNEIYYSCIEGGPYRQLELIGRDRRSGPRPMHSDVVGNLLINTSGSPVTRIGHDCRGLGSRGRYRFVNNTFILSSAAKTAIQAYGLLESVEMHNNVFWRPGGGRLEILSETAAEWTGGRRICSGLNNCVVKGWICPPEWSGTLTVDKRPMADDFRPSPGSPLLGAGTLKPASPAGYEFAKAVFPPAMEPPCRTVGPIGSALERPAKETIDIGAFGERRLTDRKSDFQ